MTNIILTQEVMGSCIYLNARPRDNKNTLHPLVLYNCIFVFI